MVKNLPARQQIQVRSLGQEDPLEKGMATHSSILAWRISRTEKSLAVVHGSHRVRHNWATITFTYRYMSVCVCVCVCVCVRAHKERKSVRERDRSNLLLRVSCFIFWRTQNIYMSHCFKLSTCSASLWVSWWASPWKRQALKKRSLNKIKSQSYRAMCPEQLTCPKINWLIN